MKKILVVDDVEDNIVLLSFDLEDDGFAVTSARSGEECLEQVNQDRPDMILLDIRMPGLSGLETLEILKQKEETRDIPVIMVSASSADHSIIRALDLGAHDFVSKPIEYPVLAARMRSALRLMQAREELEKVNTELERLATTDALTGIHNRRNFFRLAEAEFSKAARHSRPLAVLMLDVDHFKKINDGRGHAAGDRALQALVRLCEAECRDSDILGRLGGEEFVLCCPDADLNGARVLAERIRARCAEMKLEGESGTFGVTVSIGATAQLPEDQRFDDVLRRADKLLYQAKSEGRNRSVAA